MTRQFVLHHRTADQHIRQEVCCALADVWVALNIQRVRLFCAGSSRTYMTIAARDWTGKGTVQDGAGVLCRPELRCRELLARPQPQKQYTGTWQTFTLADTLRHFAQHRL